MSNRSSISDPLTSYGYEYKTAEPNEEFCRLMWVFLRDLDYDLKIKVPLFYASFNALPFNLIF